MTGKFHELRLLTDGTVEVSGPFDPERSDVRRATVYFVIVQGEGQADMVSVEGCGEWRQGDADWTATVPAAGLRADGTDGALDLSRDSGRVRGIAVALAMTPSVRSILDSSRFDPPTIEQLTWCTETRLVAAAAS